MKKSIFSGSGFFFLSVFVFLCLFPGFLFAQKPFSKRALKKNLQALLDGLCMQEPGGNPAETTPGFGAAVHYLGPPGKRLSGKKFFLVSGYSNPTDKCIGCPLKIKPDQLFELGSTTKSTTAALALYYMGQNVNLYGVPFTLDATIEELDPSIVGKDINGSVTVKQLLNMTSGIADFEEDIDYQWTVRPELVLAQAEESDFASMQIFELKQRIMDMATRPPNPYNPIFGEPFDKNSPLRFWTPNDIYNYIPDPLFPPGTNWSYSNTNYVISGQFIQGLVNFWDVTVGLEKHLWEPYQIKFYYGGYDFIPPPAMVFGWSYSGENTADTSRIAFYSSYWTAGALIGKPADLARWGLALWSPEIEVIKPEYYAQMLEFVDTGQNLYYSKRDPVPGIVNNGYGLGTMRVIVELEEDGRQVTLFGHNGKTRGFNSVVLYLPERQVAFSIVGNNGGSNTGKHDVIQLERDFTRVLMSYAAPNYLRTPRIKEEDHP